MKIKPIKAYEASDGTCWKTAAEFQRAELFHIIGGESNIDEAVAKIIAASERVGEVFSVKSAKPAKAPKQRKALGKGLRDKENNEGDTPSPDGNTPSFGGNAARAA